MKDREKNAIRKINVPPVSFDAPSYKWRKAPANTVHTCYTICFVVLNESLTSKGPHFTFIPFKMVRGGENPKHALISNLNVVQTLGNQTKTYIGRGK